MAAPSKRRLSGSKNEENCPIKNKKINTENNDEKLENFLKWCKVNSFNISPKVCVTRKGSCAQYGMVAVEDIAEGYPLFQVPRCCLLMPQNTDIAELIEKDSEELSATNQWVPLLISLIHEQNKTSSKWKPYLDLVPDYNALDLPIFWNSEDVDKYLHNSGVDLSVKRDTKMMREDFEKLVLPFFDRHKIKEDKNDFENFKKQVAFIMSYSFTEPKNEFTSNGNSEDSNKKKSDSSDDNDSSSDEEDSDTQMSPPMMVPMADMLNHVTNHNAKLTFAKESLKMVTTRKIIKGEEIFNTYGEVSNLHLMHMYGFTEPHPDNIHDVVEVKADIMLKAAIDLYDKELEDKVFLKRWEFLLEHDVISDDDVFVIGREGVISDEICKETLKVLCQSEAQFKEYQQNGGWSDGESDSSLSGDSQLSLEKIPSLDKKWKSLLKRMSEVHMANYPKDLVQHGNLVKNSSSLSPREKYSAYLIHSQTMILQLLIDACG